MVAHLAEHGHLISKSTVNNHRAKTCKCDPIAPVPVVGETVVSESGSGESADSYTISSQVAWGYSDFCAFIKSKGQDPDKVTFNWGVTTNPSGGVWNKLNNVRPKPESLNETVNVDDIAKAQKRLQKYVLPSRRTPQVSGEPCAAVLNLADMQLFKPDGDGLNGTLDRVERGLQNFQIYIDKQRANGLNLNEIVIANNGDPFEGIAGNYANQLHTVKGGLRDQMNMVLDVWTTFARTFFPQFDIAQFVSVHCNHTQFGRQGGAKDSITGDSDTGSAFLAETLERILRGREEFDHVQFTVPDDEMNVYTDIAGVPVGFNHGHKIPGNGADGFEKWLNGQVRYDRRAYDAKVWITAHRHSMQFFDLGSTSVFQCPSCDGGSKWLTDTTGKHSRSGILALTIGEHAPMNWSDHAFL